MTDNYSSETTLFDASYEQRKRPLLTQTLERLRPIYSQSELDFLRIDSMSREGLAQRSGRGFVNRDILETVLGNLLECVAPGSHNAPHLHHQKRELSAAIEEVADQLYAMVAQSFLAVMDETHLDVALETAFSLLWELPRFKSRAPLESLRLSQGSSCLGCVSAAYGYLSRKACSY